MYSRFKKPFAEALRNSENQPLINEAVITPDLFMNYIKGLRHNKKRTYLSQSAYLVKRSAFFHLYRVHNGQGHSERFRMKLSNLFRGFFRMLLEEKRQRRTLLLKSGKAVDPVGNITVHSMMQVSFFIFFVVFYFFLSNLIFYLIFYFLLLLFIGRIERADECQTVQKIVQLVFMSQRNKRWGFCTYFFGSNVEFRVSCK